MPRVNGQPPSPPIRPVPVPPPLTSAPSACATATSSAPKAADLFDAKATSRASFEYDIKGSPFKGALRETYAVMESQGFLYVKDNPGHSWGFSDAGGNKLFIEHGNPWLHPFKVTFYVCGRPSHWRPDQPKLDLAFTAKFPRKDLDDSQRLAEFAQEVKTKACQTIPPMVASQRAYMNSVIDDIAHGG